MKIGIKTVVAGALALTFGLFVSCASSGAAAPQTEAAAPEAAVSSAGGAGTTYTLNVSDAAAGTFTDGAKVGPADYFTLNVPDPETPVIIEGNSKSAEGMRFSQRLKLGGQVNTVSFTMASAGTVNIACMSSSASADRNLLFLQDGNEVTSVRSPGAFLAYSTVELAAGTYNLQSTGGGGTNIYFIEVIEK